ncbi:energy-coupling factor ABC transporter ATP-binding protein [Shimia sp. Alg240-R146]|uniref:energy-coupling factor ABC transporter ATP-binding protein n=1 Tax=Shimia sp. Alg240-R146 TaxID=2993449 RepID=UPI0022E34800|nr:ABC transporter ATP-binding protein [Shimia sp. Alg240-R146]
MIQLTNVSLAFGDHPVLHDISLTLTERRIAVIGANGSGKSSFARLLNGLALPTSGTVTIEGFDTAKKGKDVRARVGFVFQNPDNQIVFPVVEEDLAFGMKNLGLDKATIDARITEILARYDMTDMREHPAHLLSGGQKQLLAISGVLVMDPAYVVLDEPTTLLDLRNKRRVTRALNALDQTLIHVTHDLDQITDYDRVIVIDEGRVVCDDVPSKAIPFYQELMA